MNRLLLIFSILLLFSTCRKGVDYVRGTVIELGTENSVENAKIYLVREKMVKMPNYRVHAIDSATTDANGEFHIKYFKVPFSTYLYLAQKDNYLWFQDGQQNTNVLKHGRTAVTLVLTPYISYIKIKFEKTSSSTKYICGKVLNNGFFSPGSSPSSLSGPFISFTGVYHVYSIRPFTISWDIFDSNDPISSPFTAQFGHKEELSVQKADTLIYTISY